MKLLFEPFSKGYDRTNFDCEEDSLNRYLKQQVSQDIKKQVATCQLLVDEAGEVKGYYTLASSNIPRDDTPEEALKRMPYSDVPVTLLGRLAIDKSVKGNKLGEAALIHAIRNTIVASNIVASVALVVDPLNDGAAKFYKKYGFIQLESGKMFASLKSLKHLLDKKD